MGRLEACDGRWKIVVRWYLHERDMDGGFGRHGKAIA